MKITRASIGDYYLDESGKIWKNESRHHNGGFIMVRIDNDLHTIRIDSRGEARYLNSSRIAVKLVARVRFNPPIG